MVGVIAGPRSIRRLTLVHAVDDVANSLITLSMIGSLFFSVSLEASRSRILLYLVLTAAPLAVVAQVIGPALDRIRAGPRVVIVSSCIARAGCALLLSSSLLSLAFYPLVFGILVSRKAYLLARTAMVAQLASERTELVTASGHLVRTGTMAGGVGTAIGGALIALFGVEWLPATAAAVFVIAAILATGIPSVAMEPRVEAGVIHVVPPAEVRIAGAAVATIRASEGALTFLLALSIKRGGGDKWIFVAALLAAGIGTFVGTIVSPRLHRMFSTNGIIVLTLLVPGAVCALGVLTIGSLSIIGIAVAIGLGGSVAARAMDALYGSVPHLVRGRVISRNELFLQLANVTGAVIVVLIYPVPRAGFAAVAVALILGALTYASQVRFSLRHEAGRWLLGQRARVGGAEALPFGLLAEAIRYHELHDHHIAIIVADSAVRMVDARGPAPPDSAARQMWDQLSHVVDGVIAGTLEPTGEDSFAVIDAAEDVIVEQSPHFGPSPSER